MILKSLSSIVETHSPSLSAHDKRDEDYLEAAGVEMPKILKTFLSSNPFIAIKYPNLHADTIRHLFTAPHYGRKAAEAYRGLINIRLAKGHNDLVEDLPLVYFEFFNFIFSYDIVNI